MSNLQIKDFPDDLHQRLKIMAIKRNQTLYQLVVTILLLAVDEHEEREEGSHD